MLIAILHTPAAPGARPEDLDDLVQMEAVEAALTRLGHQWRPVPATINLEAAADALVALKPDCVFNLVESMLGRDSLLHLAQALLEALDMRFTGVPQVATFLTTQKLVAKRFLRAAGLPTADWWEAADVGARPPDPADRVIVKSAWAHGSVSVEDESVAAAGSLEALSLRLRSLGGGAHGWFAERYIDGREFNLSVIAGPGGPEVLPPAEIVFDGYAPDKLRIVGYRAKWVEDSFEYHHTPRRFDFPAADAPLISELARLSLQCWDIFGLRGYARVDFRVDNQGAPWILEINPNPCISPDAGLPAAAERAGIGFDELIRRILDDAMG